MKNISPIKVISFPQTVKQQGHSRKHKFINSMFRL